MSAPSATQMVCVCASVFVFQISLFLRITRACARERVLFIGAWRTEYHTIIVVIIIVIIILTQPQTDRQTLSLSLSHTHTHTHNIIIALSITHTLTHSLSHAHYSYSYYIALSITLCILSSSPPSVHPGTQKGQNCVRYNRGSGELVPAQH